tara:strand:+ start:7946 stop:8887 length:942 start_codon:yes stop_codon:yes gene_type:complete
MKYTLNTYLKDKLNILLYHGVTDKPNEGIINYQGKHINKDDFLFQMEFIKKRCSPLSIDEWVEIKKNNKRVPKYPTIISFDDGFKNNITIAAPILESLKLPSVFYITTGVIDTKKMFWVDVIEQCIHFCEKESIELYLDKKTFFDLTSNKNKSTALISIKKFCKQSKSDQKDEIINDLIDQTDVIPRKDLHDNYKTLSWNDLRQMNDNQLFTIGGHTVSHNILSSVNYDNLNYQISQCIDKLSNELKSKIQHFSYPEGQKNHFNKEVILRLKKHGIICCPTAINGYNDFNENLFQLKRVMVGFEKIDFPHNKL